MTAKPAKNFHGVGIGPLSKILAVNENNNDVINFENFSLPFLIRKYFQGFLFENSDPNSQHTYLTRPVFHIRSLNKQQ